jgi:Flp pilus assembly protein TadG
MSRRCHLSCPRRWQRGLAMVELVMTAPILLLLLFGTVVFSEWLIQYSILNDAVRDAARYVAGKALNGSTGTLIQGSDWTTLMNQGQNLAVNGNANGNVGGKFPPVLPGLTVGNIIVGQDPTTLTITVSTTGTVNTPGYRYQSLFGASMPSFFGGTIATSFPLSISTTMRAL